MLAAETRAVSVPTSVVPMAVPPFVWKQVIGAVEPFLRTVGTRLAEQIDAFDPAIAAYAEYALTGQGKQLRPALVALSGESTGKTTEAHVMVAVIIEMVHLATLVHDDVMDEAEIRRKRPTLAANWGNEISVLLGDCLFAHALKLAASFPTPEICRAVASATNTVCSGEILQTQRRRDFQCSARDYFKVLEMKTGELFALSCELGAWLSGATAGQQSGLRRFGLGVGTAYQIYDDCLDLFGSEAAAGKSLGTDLAQGKVTLPLLLVWERAAAGERAELQELIRHWRPAHFRQLLALLEQHAVLNESRQVIFGYLEAARQHLQSLPETQSRNGLFVLTEYLAQQTRALGRSGSIGI